MPQSDNSQSFIHRWGAKASAVAAILGLVAAVFVFDDRYAKNAGLKEDLDTLQTSIIAEMRREITKNRTAMISNMQRDADDLEYQISQIKQVNEPVPRYMIEKYKQIRRDIEELKSGGQAN